MTYDIAIIGTGSDPEDADTDGFAMAYRHGRAYRRLDSCRIVACADIVRENAEAFADEFDITPGNVYEDYRAMLREVEPDVVSVCVPPAVHADIVVGCAESGAVRAVHCEKPMAATWGECKEMVEACDEHGVQLTFNHQRRFGGPFRKAKELLDGGAIGPLRRIELGGENLYDYGSHLFDLCGYFNDQVPAEWVVAQIDYTEEDIRFGTHNENQALSQWRYENGVYGLASTGRGSLLECQMRLVGADGVIELGREGGPHLRMRSGSTSGWKTVDTGGDGIHGPREGPLATAAQTVARRVPFLSADLVSADRPTFIDRAIEDTVNALDEGREPELSAANALQATELIFACWESARRRRRIDLPLDVDDNPLEEMVEAGDVPVASAD